MLSFFHRLVSAFRVLFVGRVLILEVFTVKPPDGQPGPPIDRVTLWTTFHNKADVVTILDQMANSIKSELAEKERARLINLENLQN